MSKSSKIYLPLSIALLIIFAAVGYRELGNNSKPQKQNMKITQDSSSSLEATDDLINDNDADNQTNVPNTNDAVGGSSDSNDNFLDVAKTDCASNCQNFTDPDDLKYCQQVCQLVPISKDIKSQAACKDLKKLEKDYCLKDLAVNTKNSKGCDEIKDYDIQKVCQNILAQ